MSREDRLRDDLEEALGCSVSELSLEPMGGGCINEARRLVVDGERFFVKWNDHPNPRQFEAEAKGLRALAAADSGLVIPEPVVWSDDLEAGGYLVLEYLETGARGPDFDEELGHGLAALHRSSTDEGFGFALDGYCGATPQPNGWMEEWPPFYAERRLGHLTRLARERGLDTRTVDALERLVARLDEWIHDDEAPALIHGDLWSGNLMSTAEGRPALIDPAAYYGHREAELGMMALFGGFRPRVWEAYQEARPLRPGWRQRLDLYQLYHVLNHFVLFGGGYAGQTASLARQYVG